MHHLLLTNRFCFFASLRFSSLVFLLSSFLVGIAHPAHASDIERYIPANSLGYVVVQNLKETSKSVELLARALDFSIPAPLTLLRATVRHDAAINESGSMVLALLPGESEADEMQPLVLLPVSDYKALAQALQADPSGDICRIALLGEEILAAKIDDYAMLANLSNREAMQRLLDRREDPELDRETDATVADSPSPEWIAEQDAYLVLLPAGLKQIGLWKVKREKKYIYTEEDLEQSMRLSSSLRSLFGPELRQWFAEHAKLVAFGTKVNQRGDVVLRSQLALKPISPFARLAPIQKGQASANLGLVDGTAMLTAGGPMPVGWGQRLADFLLEIEKDSADTNGLAKLSNDMWNQKATANRLLLRDVESFSFAMLPGEEGEPLIGNLLGMITLPDVRGYLNSLAPFVETWNQVNAASTSDIKPEAKFDIEETEGRISCEIAIDYATTTRDDKVPALNWMLEAAFGVDGIMRIKFQQVDQTRCLVGLATDEQMASALSIVSSGNFEVPRSDEHLTALQILAPAAPWKALVQPQACLDWAARVENEFLGVLLLNTQEVEYPHMDESPPLGVSLDYQDGRWQGEIACPAVTWKVLGQYLLNYDDLE